MQYKLQVHFLHYWVDQQMESHKVSLTLLHSSNFYYSRVYSSYTCCLVKCLDKQPHSELYRGLVVWCFGGAWCTLKMHSVCFCKILVTTYKTTQCESRRPQSKFLIFGNLRSHSRLFFWSSAFYLCVPDLFLIFCLYLYFYKRVLSNVIFCFITH